jgi:hypothetical protein
VDTCQVDKMRSREEDLKNKLNIFTKDSKGIYRKGERKVFPSHIVNLPAVDAKSSLKVV